MYPDSVNRIADLRDEFGDARVSGRRTDRAAVDDASDARDRPGKRQGSHLPGA